MTLAARALLVLLILSLGVTACAPVTPVLVMPTVDPASTPAPEMTPTHGDTDVVPDWSEEGPMPDALQIVATNDMGLDLLQRLGVAATPGTNVFISPVSIALALGMTANGAAGETHAALLSALKLDGWEERDVNVAMAGLRQALNSGDLGVELSVANALWMREGVPFRQAFVDTVSTHFAARLASLDFGVPDAADTINAWVAEQTRNRITEIIAPPIDPQAVLFLINAMYFKGTWAEPFDADRTQLAPFARADASEVRVNLMQRYGSYAHVQTPDYQAVRLPYEGERLSMIVALPRQGVSVDDWVAGLDAAGWAALTAGLSAGEGSVSLPRFTLAFESVLNGVLADMGMSVAMDPARADFSRLHALGLPTWIEQVRHKTFVEVNEEGTEAAAVTSVEMRVASAPVDPFAFVADRPFLHAIQDDDTGAVLFLGVMHDPTQEEARVGA